MTIVRARRSTTSRRSTGRNSHRRSRSRHRGPTADRSADATGITASADGDDSDPIAAAVETGLGSIATVAVVVIGTGIAIVVVRGRTAASRPATGRKVDFCSGREIDAMSQPFGTVSADAILEGAATDAYFERTRATLEHAGKNPRGRRGDRRPVPDRIVRRLHRRRRRRDAVRGPRRRRRCAPRRAAVRRRSGAPGRRLVPGVRGTRNLPAGISVTAKRLRHGGARGASGRTRLARAVVRRSSRPPVDHRVGRTRRVTGRPRRLLARRGG